MMRYSYYLLLGITVALSLDSGNTLSLGRRAALKQASGGVFIASGAASANAAGETQTLSSLGFYSSDVFQVKPDATKTLRPMLSALEPKEAISKTLVAKDVRAVFLGEHHDSPRDHQLQADIIRAIKASRKASQPMAVGLEAFQKKFQPVLDAYIAGKISDSDLEDQTEWKTRWFWPFENYLPVFQLCRAEKIPMIALNVDSEDLSLVEVGGLKNLGKEALRKYIPDPQGFSKFSSTTAFKEYLEYVVVPSYASHQRMGILRTTITGLKLDQDMSIANFVSGRLLWDESMGSSAASWVKANPGGFFIGLIGADHVKFGCGVPARCARSLASPNTPSPQSAIRTVLLNASPEDTSSDPNGTASESRLTLQLRFAAIDGDGAPPVIGGDAKVDIPAARAVGQASGAVLPVADLLWFSAGALR